MAIPKTHSILSVSIPLTGYMCTAIWQTGPLYPAVGSHKLENTGTCFAAAFNIPFHLSDDGHMILYDFPD